jgi:hypothetical protein
MTSADLWQFVKNNEAVLALLGLAFVVKMPEHPPAPFDKVPFICWCWNWFRDGMLTFVNFRTPQQTQVSAYRQETPAGSITQTLESKTDTPPATAPTTAPEK